MIQDIKDELLADVPKYRMRDSQGNIIQDNIIIEQITEVLQEGTPLNRATLSNIQGDLYSQDRYNVITPTLGELVTEYHDYDILQVNDYDLQHSTKLVADGFTLTGNIGYSSSYNISKLIDGNDSSYFQQSTSQYNRAVVEIDFDYEVNIKELKINYYYTKGGMQLLATNDEVNFDVLYEQTGDITGLHYIPIESDKFYKHFKIVKPYSTTSANFYFYTLGITKCYTRKRKINFDLKLPITSIEENKIYNLEIAPLVLKEQDYVEESFTSNIIPVFSRDVNDIITNKYGTWRISAMNNSHWLVLDGDSTTGITTTSETPIHYFMLESVVVDGKWFEICPTSINFTRMTTGIYNIKGRKNGVWVDLYSTKNTSSTTTTVTTTITPNKEEYYDAFIISYCANDSDYGSGVYDFAITEGKIRYGTPRNYEKTKFIKPNININNLGLLKSSVDFSVNLTRELKIKNGELVPINSFVTGSYTGDGAYERNINVGFRPSFVILTSIAGDLGKDDTGSYTYWNGGIVIDDNKGMGYDLSSSSGGKVALKIIDNGFQVAYKPGNSSSRNSAESNYSGRKYNYIVFK